MITRVINLKVFELWTTVVLGWKLSSLQYKLELKILFGRMSSWYSENHVTCLRCNNGCVYDTRTFDDNQRLVYTY